MHPDYELVLPDNPIFWETIHSQLPPNWKSLLPSKFSGAWGVDWNTWLLKPLSEEEEVEYVLGGEYDILEELEKYYLGDDSFS